MTTPLKEVSALLDLLKAKGVGRFTGNGMCIEFGPITPIPLDVPKEADAPQPDADTCRCGHSLTEHTNGLCLHACDIELCAPKEG